MGVLLMKLLVVHRQLNRLDHRLEAWRNKLLMMTLIIRAMLGGLPSRTLKLPILLVSHLDRKAQSNCWKAGRAFARQIAELVWVMTFVVAAGWQPAQYPISRSESLTNSLFCAQIRPKSVMVSMVISTAREMEREMEMERERETLLSN